LRHFQEKIMEHGVFALKEHQELLVNRCIHHERTPLELANEECTIRSAISFLTDIVGSGKSYVLLELSKHYIDHEVFQFDTYVFANGDIRVSQKTKYVDFNTTIIVIPNRLSEQWYNYCHSYKLNIDTSCEHHILDTKTKLTQFTISSNEHIGKYRVIVVIARLYNELAQMFTKRLIRICRLIFDQIEELSISRIKHLPYKHLWFVCTDIQSFTGGKDGDIKLFKSNGFLRHIVTDLMKNISDVDLLTNLMVTNDQHLVKRCMDIPKPIIKEIRCQTPKYITLLNGVVDESIIQYLNAGDTKQALELINPKLKKTEDNIIKLIVKESSDSIDLIDHQIQMIKNMDFSSEIEQNSRIRNLTLKQDKHKSIKDHIIDRIKNTDLCNICFCTLENKTVLKCCSNSFCFECINKWFHLSNKCPICKSIVNKEKEQFIVTECNSTTEINSVNVVTDTCVSETNDKLENMTILINNSNAYDKFLIYVTSDEIRFKIQKTLDDANVVFKTLSGTAKRIQKTIREYSLNIVKVLLLDEKYNMIGLNLECTSDIILFNRVEERLQTQLIGSSNRIGRTIKEPLRLWLLLNDIDMESNS